jgi:hypothetical protein
MPAALPAKRPPGPAQRRGLKDHAKPLTPTSHELFAQMIVDGVPAPIAYKQAGFKGGDRARSQLRNHPDIKARVSWLLEQRIETATKRRHKGEKKIGDLRTRTMKELERVAFSDVRDLIQWKRAPIVDSDGSVVGYQDEVVATPSHELTRDAAASIKEVSTKSGAVRIATHDKLAALDKIARALGLFQDSAPPPSSVTVNQVNVGDVQALELARRLAFLLAMAGSKQVEQIAAPVIEGEKIASSG